MASKVKDLRKHALAALETWPKDPLRPTVQLRDVLTARYNNPSSVPAEGEVNAINTLLADKYKTRYALSQNTSQLSAFQSGGILKPKSNPEYYEMLIKDLDEVPTRTASQSWLIRLKGLFRFG